MRRFFKYSCAYALLFAQTFLVRFAQMFSITFNHSHHISYIKIPGKSPESLFFAPRISLQVSVLTSVLISYPSSRSSSEPKSPEHLFAIPSLCSDFCSVLISLSKSRTKSLFQNTFFCYPFISHQVFVLTSVLFWSF